MASREELVKEKLQPTRKHVVIQREIDTSLLYKVVRTVAKPLRPRLVKARGAPLPAGSPRLTGHPAKRHGCRILERRDDGTGVWLYDVVAETTADETEETASSSSGHGVPAPAPLPPRTRVLYFAGGGFQRPPSGAHWGFVARLARGLGARDAAVTLVSAPLAPASPAAAALPVLRRLVAAQLREAVRQGQRVVLMGDSSGGNLALSLGFWWAEHITAPAGTATAGGRPGSSSGGGGGGGNGSGGAPWSPRRAKSAPAPRLSVIETGKPWDGEDESTRLRAALRDIVVISPAADLRHTNPHVARVDPLDPLLGAAYAKEVAAAWLAAPPPPPSKTTTSDENDNNDDEDDDNGNRRKFEDDMDGGSGDGGRLFAADHPKVSPVLHRPEAYRLLASLGVGLHGVYGTHDVLAPDVDLLRDRCERHGVKGRWLVWEKQMHCFPLAAAYGLREGRDALDWLVRTVRQRAREPQV